MGTPTKIALAGAVTLVAALIIAYFSVWRPSPLETSPAPTAAPAPTPTTKTEESSLGGQIYEQVQNPAEKIPQTNPFEASTNPFENIYKNPFE